MLVSVAPTSLSLVFSYLILALSSPLCPLLHLSFYLNLWQELSSLSSCSIRLQWVPGHSCLPGNDAADEMARREALLISSGIPCSLSPLISRIHSSLFSDWRHTVSSKFFEHRFPRFPLRNLCFYDMLAVFSLALRCNGNSLLLSSYLSRIGRIKNLSCSAYEHPSQDISYLILHCPATDSLRRSLWQFSVSLRPLLYIFCFSITSDPGPGKLPGFWGLMFFRHVPIPRKGSGNNNNNSNNNSKTEITDALLRNKGI